jgi:cobalt/nickel transport system permease protein
MTLAFDQPYCAASPFSRLDPRWKLLSLIAAAVAVATLRTPEAAGVALVLAVGLVAFARLPWAWYLRRVGIVALFLAFFVVWMPDGLLPALALLEKGLALVSLMLVLIATAPPEVNLKAAHSLHVPGLLVQLVGMTHRYTYLLADEFGRLRQALRLRGFRNRADLHSYRTVGHVAGTLLVRGHERAERVGQAMRCRGFDGRYRLLNTFRTHPRDVLFGAGVLGLFLLLWVIDLVRL